MNSATTGILMRAFGVLLIGLAAFRGIKGRYRTEDSIGMTEEMDRSKNPMRFWAQIAIQAAIGLVLALGLIHV
jgi:hypothetical protein